MSNILMKFQAQGQLKDCLGHWNIMVWDAKAPGD
ncbi:hypothetical protein T09_11966 [Trichinella sp. T9]|nr:hypothetical protein T09_11966 [Trichinella sp. T9]